MRALAEEGIELRAAAIMLLLGLAFAVGEATWLTPMAF
jgi:hypothetical protein